jgi:hypothetical protein
VIVAEAPGLLHASFVTVIAPTAYGERAPSVTAVVDNGVRSVTVDRIGRGGAHADTIEWTLDGGPASLPSSTEPAPVAWRRAARTDVRAAREVLS